MDMAWWALAAIEGLEALWLVVLGGCYYRLRRVINQVDRDAVLAEKARKLRQFP